jgi:hypothetical protein
LKIIKYIIGCKTNKDKVIGGYDSTREGAKGAKYFYYILFTHLGFNREKWSHELLGGHVTWLFISCNYISTSYGLFRVSLFILGSSFIVSHSLFAIHSFSWLGHGEKLLRKESIVCWL